MVVGQGRICLVSVQGDDSTTVTVLETRSMFTCMYYVTILFCIQFIVLICNTSFDRNIHI